MSNGHLQSSNEANALSLWRFLTASESSCRHVIHLSWMFVITFAKSKVRPLWRMLYCDGISYRDGLSIDPCYGLIRKDFK